MAARGSRQVTLYDVAREAGVHFTTVSRTLNCRGPRNLDTAPRRVRGFRAAIREAGHRAAIVPVPFDEAGGFRAMLELLGRDRPPTGGTPIGSPRCCLLGDCQPGVRAGHDHLRVRGISGIPVPGAINPQAHPVRVYLVTLVIALALLAMLRYLARTPFGLALQGIRADPVRMRSLGDSVALHRTVAFALAGFVAAVGGILFVWWNEQISPSTIGLPSTINILVIAVIGGL